MNRLARTWGARRGAATHWVAESLRGVGFGLALGFLLSSGVAHGQRVVEGKGFKFAEYYEAPHEAQMKLLLEGEKGQPGAGGRILIAGAKLHTFRENGEAEMAVETPECVYDPVQRTVSSARLLQVRTLEGKFQLEGEGFMWQHTNSSLLVSNRVHTFVHPDLLQAQSTNAPTPATRAGAGGIEISSDRVEYAANTGLAVYRGNVRLTGTNLALAGAILTVTCPISGPLKAGGMQDVTIEGDVVIDYEQVHASGDHASYSPETDLLRLTGRPARWQADQREGRGEEMVLDRGHGFFRTRGQAWLSMSRQGTGGSGFLPEPYSAAAASPAATNQTVEIHSDNYEVRTNLAVFRGGVQVSERRGDRAQGKLSCGTLSAAFSGTNELQRLVAETDVILEQETNRFTANKAVYSGPDGILELAGNPTWRSGLREGRGDLIRVDTKRNQMLVRSNAFMRLPSGELGQTAVSGLGATVLAGAKAGPRQFAEIACREYTVGLEGAQFQGGVRLDHPRIQWTCERINVLAPPGGGRISRTVAEQGVVFHLTDDSGRDVTGTGDKAVYTCNRTATATNEVMELTGFPAKLTTASFSGQNNLFILDLVNRRLGAPGRSRFAMQALASGGGTNIIRMPGEMFRR
jgi:lipopolysaccharide export system protein LptA